MTLIIESAENGYTLREPSEESGVRDSISVVEEITYPSEIAEQLTARKVLWEVMEKLGFHFSKHGPKLYIEIRDIDGQELDDEGKVVKANSDNFEL